MRTLVYLWAAVAVVFVAVYMHRETKSGLGLAYVVVLFINYWVGAAVYLSPNLEIVLDPELTRLGLQQCFFGLVAFAIGCLAIAPLFRQPPTASATPRAGGTFSGAARWYLPIGAFSYIALSTVLQVVPSATSMAAVGQQLVVVALCLLAHHAWRNGRRLAFALIVASSVLLPLVTILNGGFLIFGAVAMFAVLTFVSTIVPSRMVILGAGMVLAYLSLSLYVTYLRDRTEIRQLVGSRAPAAARLSQARKTGASFEFFSKTNPRHLAAIDHRLNLSYLTGAAVRQLSTRHDFAGGKTLLDAASAAVPRVLWPGKPVAGGSAVVTKYTGIRFYGSTSVGTGPVMEFYINFGTAGVVIGFLGIGVLIGVLDTRAATRLRAGDEQGFALFFVLGLCLLQVGGSFVDVVSTGAATIVFMMILQRAMPVQPTLEPPRARPLPATSTA